MRPIRYGADNFDQAPEGLTLRQDLVDDASENIGQAVTPPLMFVDQPLVIDAQQVQKRGLQVVHVDAVADNVVTVGIGLAMDGARLDAAAGHPQRETARVVVSAETRRRELALRPNSPPQMTSVSSSMPRRLRSRINAAEARSVSWQYLGRFWGRLS